MMSDVPRPSPVPRSSPTSYGIPRYTAVIKKPTIAKKRNDVLEKHVLEKLLRVVCGGYQ